MSDTQTTKTTARYLDSIAERLKSCEGETRGGQGGADKVYIELFNKVFGCTNNSKHNCDGCWHLPEKYGDNVYLLTEFKGGRDFKSLRERCKVLAQVVYYLREFYEKDGFVPKVGFVGDENEGFVFSATLLWDKMKDKTSFDARNASSAYTDEALMNALLKEEYTRHMFVYDINDGEDIESIIYAIVNVAKAEDGYKIPFPINNSSIDKVWKTFKQAVFGTSSKNVNEQVSLFVAFVTGDKKLFRNEDETKINAFSFNGTEYDVVNPKKAKSFANHYDYSRSGSDNRYLRATCDRFIADMNRRKKGEFYTPTVFVDYAHEMIAEEFGEDWKEKYAVWDPAWGTGNLTRDYMFNELYASTLEQAELDIAKNVNPEATKFQFDFLNDDFDKLPVSLQNLLTNKNKELIVFYNPPFFTANSSSCKKKDDGGYGIKGHNTKVAEEMRSVGLGKTSKESYVAFMYRVCMLQEKFGIKVHVAMFCNPKFLTGQRHEKFRNILFRNLEFRKGILFNASHFSGVSVAWGITFNLWKSGETKDKNNFEHTMVDEINGDIKVIGTKTLYNTDGTKDSALYVKEAVKGKKRTKEVLSLSGALGVRGVETVVEGSLGTIFTSGLSCGQFNSYIWMLSTACNHMGNGTCITPDNFHHACNLLSVAKLCTRNWVTDKDEFFYVDDSVDGYEEFKNDAMVYALFTSGGEFSSLRNVNIEGKVFDVKNEFFWMSKDEIKNIVDDSDEWEEVDMRGVKDTYVFNKLKETNLSPEAQAVLDKASDIVRKSFKYRQNVHFDHPEYHLNAWDAGWYQIKKLVSSISPSPLDKDMEEFKVLFNALADKMRPMVYELGFLKN